MKLNEADNFAVNEAKLVPVDVLERHAVAVASYHSQKVAPLRLGGTKDIGNDHPPSTCGTHAPEGSFRLFQRIYHQGRLEFRHVVHCDGLGIFRDHSRIYL